MPESSSWMDDGVTEFDVKSWLFDNETPEYGLDEIVGALCYIENLCGESKLTGHQESEVASDIS